MRTLLTTIIYECDFMILKKIAYIKTDFPEKFGIPRQSGLVDTIAEIHFLPEYSDPSSIRGLEEYSHLWLIWEFSANSQSQWHPTVRPPRLGGNKRVGVFATRSPFRPNPIGLSCVTLESIEIRESEGPVLIVKGADLLDQTPIYDIKPYLPYVDCKQDAKGSFSSEKKEYHLEIFYDDAIFENINQKEKEIIIKLLAQDPRPSYHEDPSRIYGMAYNQWEIKFKVENTQLQILQIIKKDA